MDTVIITIGIPLALMVMMFGLGLDLTLGDFREVWRRPRAALVAASPAGSWPASSATCSAATRH